MRTGIASLAVSSMFLIGCGSAAPPATTNSPTGASTAASLPDMPTLAGEAGVEYEDKNRARGRNITVKSAYCDPDGERRASCVLDVSGALNGTVTLALTYSSKRFDFTADESQATP